MDRTALAAHLRTKVQLQQRLERELLPTGIAGFDTAMGGVPRGAITEAYGPPSSGKTTFLYALLAHACAAGEFCALVDGNDSFDPGSAASAGTDFHRFLWIRCIAVEQAIRCADLLVHSGGWGVVVLDLSGVRADLLRKVPLSYWYRFKRAVENTPTALMVLACEPNVKNCSAMTFEFSAATPIWSGTHRDFQLLRGLEAKVTPRKPVGSENVFFKARALA